MHEKFGIRVTVPRTQQYPKFLCICQEGDLMCSRLEMHKKRDDSNLFIGYFLMNVKKVSNINNVIGFEPNSR